MTSPKLRLDTTNGGITSPSDTPAMDSCPQTDTSLPMKGSRSGFSGPRNDPQKGNGPNYSGRPAASHRGDSAVEVVIREVCDWCQTRYVGGRVSEDAQVGHGKLCDGCVERVVDLRQAGSALPTFPRPGGGLYDIAPLFFTL